MGLAVFLGSAALYFYAAGFLDDHYDRITRARQMSAYGAMPFRDFFDPGYGLTLYAAKWAQELFGYNLFGQTLLCVGALAAGFTLVCLLATRISRSWAVVLLVTALAVAAEPRFYDFDKVFFYPAGIAACWAYAERPSRTRLVWLAGVTALAALFRYDNGLYIGSAALVAVSATHWSVPRTLWPRLALYAGAVAIAVSPALLMLAAHGVLRDAFEQVATYAVAEGRRTSLFRPATFTVDWSVPVVSLAACPSELPLIKVRWDSSLGTAARAQLETRYGLVCARQEAGATWVYRIQPASTGLLQEMVADPLVRDTHGIDRTRLLVQGLAETPIDTWRRRVPLLRLDVLRGWWHADNAVAWMYYLIVLLPPVTVATLVLDRGARDGVAVAAPLSAAVLCLLVNAFVLRDPFNARLGAVVPPATLLGAWVFRRRTTPAAQSHGSRRSRAAPVGPAGRALVCAAATVLLGLTCASILTLSNWRWRLTRGEPVEVSRIVGRAQDVWAHLRQSPPSLEFAPTVTDFRVAQYLRACSPPSRAVMATWFAPQLYFFAGRPFAAGMVVFFGDHWSSPKYQRRAIERLSASPPSLVIEQMESYDDFRTTYPFIDRHLRRDYEVAGETTFGVDGSAYRVLVERSRPVAGRDPAWGLPGLAGGSAPAS